MVMKRSQSAIEHQRFREMETKIIELTAAQRRFEKIVSDLCLALTEVAEQGDALKGSTELMERLYHSATCKGYDERRDDDDNCSVITSMIRWNETAAKHAHTIRSARKRSA